MEQRRIMDRKVCVCWGKGGGGGGFVQVSEEDWEKKGRVQAVEVVRNVEGLSGFKAYPYASCKLNIFFFHAKIHLFLIFVSKKGEGQKDSIDPTHFSRW